MGAKTRRLMERGELRRGGFYVAEKQLYNPKSETIVRIDWIHVVPDSEEYIYECTNMLTDHKMTIKDRLRFKRLALPEEIPVQLPKQGIELELPMHKKEDES